MDLKKKNGGGAEIHKINFGSDRVGRKSGTNSFFRPTELLYF